MAGVVCRVIGSKEQIQLNRMMCNLLYCPDEAADTAAKLCEKYQYQPEQKLQAAVFFPRVTDNTICPGIPTKGRTLRI